MDNCPYCGTLLKETNLGRKWCPNCGIIEEESSNESEEKPNYVG
ncbi:MAG: transposase [Nanoarchaeota archaeon]|nr:transposase [Nanoarchaeota archaeon]